MFVFDALNQTPGYDLADALKTMLAQKAQVGLITSSANPTTDVSPRHLVPVVAAPDDLEGDAWFNAWSDETQDIRAELDALLGGLEFWRLSKQGEILERRVV